MHVHSCHWLLAFQGGLLLACMSAGARAADAATAGDTLTLDNQQAIKTTRFLEEKPLDEIAPSLRALLLKWEDKSPDVKDIVCPAIFQPVDVNTTKHSGELIFQTIFGSAAFQLANPAEKGHLLPSQVAGMRSLLKAYRAMVAVEPSARIPRFDEFARVDAEGRLPEVMAALLVLDCHDSVAADPSFAVPAPVAVQAPAAPGPAGARLPGDATALDKDLIPSTTHYLEGHPLDKNAPGLRALLSAWIRKYFGVNEVMCSGVFKPVNFDTNKYSADLIYQSIFGSAVYQLAHPAEKGQWPPSQLAGMQSTLKSYQILLAQEPSARIPRLDELARIEADGKLPETINALVATSCRLTPTTAAEGLSPAPAAIVSPATEALAPWHFGMTPAQVVAFTQYGPYRSFTNGDVETYAYPLVGAPRNVQFYFGPENKHGAAYGDGLRRVSIHFYEGSDLAAATAAWRELYGYLKQTYGAVELPDLPQSRPLTAAQESQASSPDNLAQPMAAHAKATGRSQMAPMLQPENRDIFSSFVHRIIMGTDFYEVVLYVDPSK